MKNNDINAFPSPAGGGCGPDPGMTLRDYFAAKAMAGITSDNKAMRKFAEVYDDNAQETVAEWCYEMADAMMEERERE